MIEPDIIISLPITTSHLWIVMVFLVLIFGAASAVFIYHWNYYGIKGNRRVFAKSLYFIISISLLVLAVLFIGAYGLI